MSLLWSLKESCRGAVAIHMPFLWSWAWADFILSANPQRSCQLRPFLLPMILSCHDSVFFLMVAAPLPCVSAAAPGQGLNRYLPVDLIAQILAALSKNVRAPITQWWWFWKIEDAHPRVASPLCA